MSLSIVDQIAESAPPNSWGDLIRRREADRTKPAPVSADAGPRHSRTQSWSLRPWEHAYNPVTQTFNDPKIEKEKRVEEHQKSITKINAAKDYSLQYESNFNILNSQDERRGLYGDRAPAKPGSSLPQEPYTINSSVDYNILNHLAYSESFPAPPELRPRPMENRLSKEHGAATMGRRALSAFRERTNYNVVTNKYKEFDEEKTTLDKQVAENEAKIGLSKRTYNPLVQQYYDPGMQEEFDRLIDNHFNAVRKAKEKQIPYWIKRSEGQLYDTVTFTVRDPNGMSEYEKEVARKTKLKNELRDHHTNFVQTVERKENLHRSLPGRGRTFDRRNDYFEHDFDIITTESYVGRDSKPRVVEKLEQSRAWDQITSTIPVLQARSPNPFIASCDARQPTRLPELTGNTVSDVSIVSNQSFGSTTGDHYGRTISDAVAGIGRDSGNEGASPGPGGSDGGANDSSFVSHPSGSPPATQSSLGTTTERVKFKLLESKAPDRSLAPGSSSSQQRPSLVQRPPKISTSSAASVAAGYGDDSRSSGPSSTPQAVPSTAGSSDSRAAVLGGPKSRRTTSLPVVSSTKVSSPSKADNVGPFPVDSMNTSGRFLSTGSLSETGSHLIPFGGGLRSTHAPHHVAVDLEQHHISGEGVPIKRALPEWTFRFTTNSGCGKVRTGGFQPFRINDMFSD